MAMNLLLHPRTDTLWSAAPLPASGAPDADVSRGEMPCRSGGVNVQPAWLDPAMGSHPVGQLLDLAALPVGDIAGPAHEDKEPVRDNADAPPQEDPLDPPPAAGCRVDDGQPQGHDGEHEEMQEEALDGCHLPRRLRELLSLAHRALAFRRVVHGHSPHVRPPEKCPPRAAVAGFPNK